MSEICGICGCDIALVSSKNSKPVRHAGKVYCADCARLILDPDTDRGAEDIEVPDPDYEALERVQNTPTNVDMKAVAGGGIEVVEQFRIKAVGAPPAQSRERKLEDDDWFKQANPKPGPVSNSALAVRDKKGGTSISKRAEVEKKTSQRSMNAVKPSGKLSAVKSSPPSKQISARNIPAVAPEVLEESEPPERTSKKSSRRLAAVGKGSGRLAALPPASRAKLAPAQAKDPEPEPMLEEPLDDAPEEAAEEAAPQERGSRKESKRNLVAAPSRPSSRRMKAAKRGASSKPARGERNNRSERSEKGEREERGRGKSKSADSTNMMMIGGAVAALVVLVICVALSGGAAKQDVKKDAAPTEIATSSSELAQQASVLEAKGDRLGAADLYGRAAEAATNNEQAQQYNMHAYQLRKFTTLNMKH